MRRSLLALAAGAILIGTALTALTATGAAAVPATSKSAGTYAIGDCYATGDLARDEITLSSKVPCSSAHSMQILGGTAIPSKLLKAGYQTLRKQSSKAYQQLDAFAWTKACTLRGTVGAAYPTTGAALAKALAEHKSLAFYPGSPGGMGWVLPDRDAFNAGVTDVICVFALDPAALAGGVGDVRQLETAQMLPKFRICVSIDASRKRTSVPCDVVHDRETLAFVSMAVDGLPKDLRTWTDAQWSPFDAACTALGEVLMGGAHPEVKVAADTDFDIPADTGVRGVSTLNRVFSCNVKNPDAAGHLPAGTVTALGAKKLVLSG